MKTAQELRVGNVVMINNTPMVILKSEYSKGGRGAKLRAPGPGLSVRFRGSLA